MFRSLGTTLSFLVLLSAVRSEEKLLTVPNEPVTCQASFMNSGLMITSPSCFPCKSQCEFFLKPTSNSTCLVSMQPFNTSISYVGSFIQPFGMFGMYQIYPVVAGLMDTDKALKMTLAERKKAGCALLKLFFEAMCSDCTIPNHPVKTDKPLVPDQDKPIVEGIYNLIIKEFDKTGKEIAELVYKQPGWDKLINEKHTDVLIQYLIYHYKEESEANPDFEKKHDWQKYRLVLLHLEYEIQKWWRLAASYDTRGER